MAHEDSSLNIKADLTFLTIKCVFRGGVILVICLFVFYKCHMQSTE